MYCNFTHHVFASVRQDWQAEALRPQPVHPSFCSYVRPSVLSFLPRDAMRARPMSSCGFRPSVCLSVRVSVMFVHSVTTNNISSKFFHPRVATTILVFRTKRHSNIPTTTPPPLTRASNAGGVVASVARVWRYRNLFITIIITIIRQKSRF